MTIEIKSYKDLIVWQKSIELIVEIYKLTEFFPKEEVYGLISQIRRASISIPSNIAEGYGRGTRKDYKHFIQMSLGSANELDTQIIIAKRLPKLKNLDYSNVDSLLVEVLKMLKTLTKKLSFMD